MDPLGWLPPAVGRLLLRQLYALQYGWCWLHRPVTLGVRLLLIDNDTIILVRHTYTSGWFLPGGGVGRGETTAQAARREAFEECGAKLHRLQLFGVYDHFHRYKYDHVFAYLSDDFSLVTHPIDSVEIAEIERFKLHQLPAATTPGTQRRVEAYRQRYGDGARRSSGDVETGSW